MALRKAESFKDYLAILRAEPHEVSSLYEDILITVTAFFRNPEVFKTLKSAVFPAILKGREANLPVRIWVPGCSTGEEVYSVAITLFEAMQLMDVQPPVQIFATDISETAIERARAACYIENAMADVSPERRKRFFSKNEKGWQVSRNVRDVCVFAHQNLTSDPPFSNLDLISCRNLLIYLEPVLQRRVLPLFHYALRPGGYLMLGNAESISGFGELFTPVDRQHRIFLKRPGGARPPLDFQRPQTSAEGAEPAPARAGESSALELQKEADRAVLGRFGPPGVLVNDNYDIVQFRGRTSAVSRGGPGHGQLQRPEDGAGGSARGTARRPPQGEAHGKGRSVRKGSVCGRTAMPATSTWRSSRCRRPSPAPITTWFCSKSPTRGRSRSRRSEATRVVPRAAHESRAARQARTGADRDQGLPAVDHRGAGGLQRGAEVGQRGDPLLQRGAAVHQRGARDREGGAPVHQRGAQHGQRRAPEPQQRADARSTTT